MVSSIGHQDLIERLQYTFITGELQEIDELITEIEKKDHFESLCMKFFQGCSVDPRGTLVLGGFFAQADQSPALAYAMYQILGRAPDTFLLKYKVTRVKILYKGFKGRFKLPKGLLLLPNLQRLIVRKMGMARLPDFVIKAQGLQILDLSGNQFTDFPQSILNLTGLSALNLAFNNITSIPEELNRLKSLRILSLRGNEIDILPTDWKEMQCLRSLDLSMNRISSVPDSINKLFALQKLKLSYNNIPASSEALWEKKISCGEGSSQGSLGFSL